MLEDIFLRSIKYIADIHDKNLFHGDIKPANLFYNNSYKKLQISSDSGSLVQLDKDNIEKKYYIRYYTDGFSSSKHKKAIKNKIGETKDELF